jgi:NadR type nicotinamide-nucleotide adenylyltransferase
MNQQNGLNRKQIGIPAHLSIRRIAFTVMLSLKEGKNNGNHALPLFVISPRDLINPKFEYPAYKMEGLKKIVVIGPESTGKSSLCKKLAEHYNTSWCPEYAREYLLTRGIKYEYDDLLMIARGQADLEDRFVTTVLSGKNGNKMLFIDTDMYVMKVWCEFAFGKCHRFILDELVKRKYDLYLLCNIDLPWIKDELREYPYHATRQKLYSIYMDIMINQSIPWVEISGNNEERIEKAIAAVEKLT